MTNPEPLQYGQYYHIYNRGNSGGVLFHQERNYPYFLSLYAKYIEPIAETYAYCLMSNHFHLLVRIKAEEELAQTGPVFKTGPVFHPKHPSRHFNNLFIVLKGGMELPFASLADAQAAGAVTINYGVFINTIISFILVALAVFILIRNINKMKKQEEEAPAEPTTKDCSFCFTTIPIKATRCPNCTAELA